MRNVWFFLLIVPGTKLSEDCFRYGSENTASDAILAKAACLYGGALRNVEKEYEDFNQILSNQVFLSLHNMLSEFGLFWGIYYLCLAMCTHI